MIPSEADASAEVSECAQGKLAVKPRKGSGEHLIDQTHVFASRVLHIKHAHIAATLQLVGQ